MIFQPLEGKGQVNNSTPFIGAARRMLLPLVSTIHQTSTKRFLKKLLNAQKGIHALHMACGYGKDTCLIAHQLDRSAKLYAIEEDPILVELAKKRNEEDWIHFTQSTFNNWNEQNDQKEQLFDFIFVRIWIAVCNSQQSLLSTFHRMLKPNGILVIQLVSFGGYAAFPYNYAFARSNELIQTIETRPDDVLKTCLEQIQQVGFKGIAQEFYPSIFIPPHCNNIFSLFLENFKPQILKRTGILDAELNALLTELKAFENQKDTLIGRPGMHQFQLRK